MKKNKIETILFIMLLIGGLGYGYYKYVLSGQIADINAKKKVVTVAQDQLESLRKISDDKKGKLREIAKMERQIVVLDKAIPQVANNYEFNMAIFNKIKAYGLNIKNLEPQNPITANGFESQIVNISVSGRRDKVLEFIKYLQDNERKIEIKEATIREVNANELEVVLKVNTYYVKQ